MPPTAAAIVTCCCCCPLPRAPAVIVSPGASADGSALLGDNDDSGSRHGLVTHFAAADHAPGAQREVYRFETGEYLGIPQPAHKYNVMAHANDQGLVIGETTHGGLEVLHQHANSTEYVLDYGSLIHITLQRAKTAREAVHTIAELTGEYGYATSMEGFSITDGKEAWYMELVGKGLFGKGIVWVALRVPEGYVTAHANQARITTFLPCNNPNTCLAAPDAVTFAIEHGFYNGSAHDPSFSFSDTYDPVTPTGARFCEARVWYIFSGDRRPSRLRRRKPSVRLSTSPLFDPNCMFSGLGRFSERRPAVLCPQIYRALKVSFHCCPPVPPHFHLSPAALPCCTLNKC